MEGTKTIYVVRPGDTLAAIANRFGASIDELATLNAVTDRNLLVVGQEIEIPAEGSNGPPSPKPELASTESAEGESAMGGATITTDDGISIRLDSVEQAEFVLFYYRIRSFSSLSDWNMELVAEVEALILDPATFVAPYDYYRIVKGASEANRSLWNRLLAWPYGDPPSGLDHVLRDLRFAIKNRADGLDHAARYLNDGDFEELRKAEKDLEEARFAYVAVGLQLVRGAFVVGLPPESLPEMVSCTKATRKCVLVPSDG